VIQPMTDELPKGWVKTTLGEIAEPSRERGLPMQFPDLRYVGLEHIEAQKMKLIGHGYGREVRSSSVRFSKGDVLYGKMRPYLNKVWVAEFDGLCSAEFLVFPKRDGLNNQFLAMRLNAEDFVTFANGQVSGERPRVDFEKLSRFPISLPPSLEQDRIVAKLSGALSRIMNGEAAADRARERLVRYRAAVLRAAVLGELTRQWREDNQPSETAAELLRRLLRERRARWEKAELESLRQKGIEAKGVHWESLYPEPVTPRLRHIAALPDEWTWATIEQLASGVPGCVQSGPFGSQLLHSEFVEEGILAIGIDNVLDGRFSLGSQHRITQEKYNQLKKFTARPNDVVVTVMATVGRVCVLPASLEPAIITKHCYRISPATKAVSPHFLALALRADAPTRQHLLGNIRGQTRPGINGSILKSAPIPLPPVIEQAEIVREVKHRLAAADRLTNTLDRQLERTPAARNHLLHQAVAGHFIPQDPNDEPASFLLGRIRAAREAEAQKPKGRQMSKSKSEMKATERRGLLAVLKEKGGPMTPEELFHASGHSQDSVDQFFAELRDLTTTPTKIVEERKSGGRSLLRAMP
jgi:type I restriction enzyme, S subunit